MGSEQPYPAHDHPTETGPACYTVTLTVSFTEKGQSLGQVLEAFLEGLPLGGLKGRRILDAVIEQQDNGEEAHIADEATLARVNVLLGGTAPQHHLCRDQCTIPGCDGTCLNFCGHPPGQHLCDRKAHQW